MSEYRRMSSDGSNSPQSTALDTASIDGGSRAGSIRSKRPHIHAEDNVKVICRVRPFSQREIEIQNELNSQVKDEWDKQPLRSVVEMEGNATIILDREKWIEKERFNFDLSLWSVPDDQQASPNGFASQETVMEKIGIPALSHIWDGYNTCIFAYGQTGSGKTYTMMGTEEEAGLIPRLCQEMFAELERRRANIAVVEGTTRSYRLEARFLEIYNEKVKDLLWELRKPAEVAENIDKDNLKVRNIPGTGPVVVGVTTVLVEKWEDCLALIDEGTKHRSVAATLMNATSSRSHSIFRLNCVQTTTVHPTKQFERPKSYDRTSIVSLVDLAGSERNKKTKAIGERLKEAVAINQSLTTLKNVIDALVEGRQVIPYRDSQLTWLLSDNLGGNSKTFMISCVSPHFDNHEETLNTLRYALRAQGIQNRAQVNESEEMRRLNRIREEMERISRQIRENPGEDDLRREVEEQQAALNMLKVEALRKQREAEELAEQMAGSKALLMRGRYHHAFRVCFLKRVTQHFLDKSVFLAQDEKVSTTEIATRQQELVEKEQIAKTVGIEEQVARQFLAKLHNEANSLKQKSVANEELKKEMTKLEAMQRDKIVSKANLLLVAKQLTKILCAHEFYLWDKIRTELGSQRQAELSNLRDSLTQQQQKATEQCRTHREYLAQSIEKLKKKIVESQETHQQTLSKKSRSIAKLHAECIFYENENKRCFKELDQGLARVNQAGSSRFYETKEMWKDKIQQLHVNNKLMEATRQKEHRIRESMGKTEHCHELRELEEKSRAQFQEAKRNGEDSVRSINENGKKVVSKLDALNADTQRLLKEVSHSEPRYKKAFDHVKLLLSSASACDTQRIRDLLLHFQPRFETHVPSKLRYEEAPQVQCDPVPKKGVPSPPPRCMTPKRSSSCGRSVISSPAVRLLPLEPSSPVPTPKSNLKSLQPLSKEIHQTRSSLLLQERLKQTKTPIRSATPPARAKTAVSLPQPRTPTGTHRPLEEVIEASDKVLLARRTISGVFGSFLSRSKSPIREGFKPTTPIAPKLRTSVPRPKE